MNNQNSSKIAILMVASFIVFFAVVYYGLGSLGVNAYTVPTAAFVVVVWLGLVLGKANLISKPDGSHSQAKQSIFTAQIAETNAIQLAKELRSAATEARKKATAAPTDTKLATVATNAEKKADEADKKVVEAKKNLVDAQNNAKSVLAIPDTTAEKAQMWTRHLVPIAMVVAIVVMLLIPGNPSSTTSTPPSTEQVEQGN